ncbi:phosphoribosyl 1,2-cyclic phosphate phosphodiesterase [Pontibacter ummariensis]|uniref:Phosphoribosyl 1,2-cyclic phosphate phosphodiesterase n=1 Tax=Pontibacter ummariensis TaxID=1610492 RepID=A0A239J531_9BACT|nr:MBL fold metallo-hydrolase [Pontibacter ummariensis]PRY08892.1 phosphoribosyl 1,2-cyclic phosphate phosphodiesterase [Pontibacter ummariensis]SNT01126.1 phosphoribosyl 1,2-cyclic phosphate phosphodiesterase [Pontibacter ummariensis]
MKVTLLGTGTSQGVPVIGCSCEVCRSVDYRDQRLRVSVHLEVAGKSIIIDSGPDFRQQVLRERIKTLDALVFTHEHKDHTAGLDDIRAYNFSQRKDMPLYAEERVLKQLKQEFSYIFADFKYPGIPQVRLHTIDGLGPFEVEGVLFTPIRVMHYRLPVLGYRVGDFSYITDANFISEEEKEKVKGSKVIVLDALRHEPHISHFSLEEAVALLEELQPEQAYLTHISHLMGLHREVEAELPEFIRLGYDGLQIEV